MSFTLRGNDVCQATQPTPLPSPYWVGFSASAAQLLKIPLSVDGLPADPQWLELLAGNTLRTEDMEFSEPLSTAYSGHQFGVWAGQLGDGRAILLGDLNGQELQLKAPGKPHTPEWVMAGLYYDLLFVNFLRVRQCMP